MKTDRAAQLLQTIERDVDETSRLVQESAFSGHALLASQAYMIDELPLARLFLATASLGAYRPQSLYPVAAGLELLRLAAFKHYRDPKAATAEFKNLSLVSADYYYAKAIALAVPLNDGRIVGHMVRAIAELAEGQADAGDGFTLNVDAAGKSGRLSLFRSAIQLGILAGGCPVSLEGPLSEYASLFGLACEGAYAEGAGEDGVSGGAVGIGDIVQRALSHIAMLPEPQRRFFEKLIRRAAHRQTPDHHSQ